MSVETLVLGAADVVRALPPAACREAVERAFRLLAEGRTPAPRSLGFEAHGGTFHAKVARFDADPPCFVAKINGNFPGNPRANGLPTIQGVLVLADACDGRPLAVMDSGSLTAIRTAAASAVAARHLMRRDASVLAVIGCGRQGLAHADALLDLHPFREIRFHDAERPRAVSAAAAFHEESVMLRVADSPAAAARGADVIATCTTGAEFVLAAGDVGPGAFVAAVGADHPGKREIHPLLMRAARVVVDDLDQCAAGGDLHHALSAGTMRAEDVRGDLASVVAGRIVGRAGEDEIVVFDSTGIALEDAAAAQIVYDAALSAGLGVRVKLGE